MLDLRCRKHRATILSRGVPRQFDRVIHRVLFQVRCPGDGRLVPRALVGEHVLGGAPPLFRQPVSVVSC
jgi:hypothetical protein